MSLKRENRFIFSVASTEIFILICAIFAFGFLVSQTSFVTALIDDPGAPTDNSNLQDQAVGGIQAAAAVGSAAGTIKTVTSSTGKVLFKENIVSEPPKGFAGALNKPSPSVSRAAVLPNSGYVPHGTISELELINGKKVDINIADLGGTKKVSDGYELFAKDSTTSYGTVSTETYDKLKTTLASKNIGVYEPATTDIFGIVFHGGWSHLVDGIIYAGIAAGAIQLIGNLAGFDKGLTNSLTIAAVAGLMTYKGIASLGPTGFQFLGEGNFFIEHAGLIGIGVAAVVFVLLYKKESKKYVQFQCLPWEAPLGGAKCEECNKDLSKPCSEYRCKSLGQACNLVNPGTTEEKCVWVNPKDVTSPTITPWTFALSKDHKYTNDNTRPPSLGAKITRTDQECIRPFTPLQFGIITNEASQCKIDYVHTNTFDQMQFYFGESNYYAYNHTQTMRLPSPDTAQNASPELQNDGNYNLYTRCRDANGNENVDEFVFSFCVDKSPDTTPPVIESTSIISGSPVTFGAQRVPLTVYVNEPAQCKWSIQDKAYADMENTMSCATNVYEQNSQQLYPCSTQLTGIKDKSDNVYYFRCKDQPSKADGERNTNTQSYRFNLRGSQTLNIISAGPNGTIIGSADVVPVNLQVETSNGADEGKAVCYFSPTGNAGSFISMFGTNSFQHNQTLSLTAGNYNYYFRCVDAGGNSDNRTTSFNIFVDRTSPIVTRIYREIDALKIVTNEDAECSYSLNNCNFQIKDGVKFIYSNPSNKQNHFTQWQINKLYYIRCADKYGNEPASNICNLIVSPSSVK